MTNDWNNVKPVGCKPWLVLPAVYSDALSYGDQIAHFCAALNKLIQNNNTLPEYIQQMIQAYINGDVIGEVVQNIVSQSILNVKYPPENLKPAVGDGSADDTEAIQGCINYAKNHNGMAVYIPSGAYSVQSLTLPGDVSLFGFDRYTTKLVLRGGATTPMISSTGTGFSIVGLTLDGNAGVQVENINVLSLISQDVLLRDLIVQNGYKLLDYNGTGGHLQMTDIVFGNALNECMNISGNSLVQAKGLMFTQLSSIGGVDVLNVSADNGMYEFMSTAVCQTCLNVSGKGNYFKGMISEATTPYIDSGENILSIITDSNIIKNFNEYTGNFNSFNINTNTGTINGNIIKFDITDSFNINTNNGTIKGNTIKFDTTNPLQYGTIVNGDMFNVINWEDINGTEYSVLVKNENTEINIETLFKNSDDSLIALNNMLKKYDSISILKGDFTITNTPLIIPNGKMLNCNGAKFIVTENIEYAILLGDQYTPSSGNTNTKTYIKNAFIDCNYMSSGILIQVSSALIDNIRIIGASTSGIDVYNQKLIDTYGPSPSDATIGNVQIYWKNSVHTFTQYGIRLYGSDNDLYNIRTLSTVIGIWQSTDGMSLYCTNCHPLGADGFNSIWPNTVGYYLQASAVSLVNCYSDKFRYGIRIKGRPSQISVNSFVYLCTPSETYPTDQRAIIIYENPGTFDFKSVKLLTDPVPMLIKEAKGIYFGALPSFTFDRTNVGTEPSQFNMEDNSLLCKVTKRDTYEIHSTSNEILVAILNSITEGTPAIIDIAGIDFLLTNLTIQTSPESYIYQGNVYPTTQNTIQIKIYKDNDNSLYVYLIKSSATDSRYSIRIAGASCMLLPREVDNIQVTHNTSPVQTYSYNT